MKKTLFPSAAWCRNVLLLIFVCGVEFVKSACPSGTYTKTPGSSVCQSCPTNSFSPVGSTAITACGCTAAWNSANSAKTVYTVPASGTRAQQNDQAWCPDFVAPSAGFLHEVTTLCTGALNNGGYLVLRNGAQFRDSVFIADAVGPQVSIGSTAYETRTRVIGLNFQESDRFTGLQITTMVRFPRSEITTCLN